MYNDVEITRGPRKTHSAPIAGGATTSDVVDCRGLLATHVYLPAGFDGTSLKPQGSMDGVTFADIYENDDTDGSAVTMTVAAERMYELPKEVWGLPYLRFVAGSQTGAVTLTVALS